MMTSIVLAIFVAHILTFSFTSAVTCDKLEECSRSVAKRSRSYIHYRGEQFEFYLNNHICHKPAWECTSDTDGCHNATAVLEAHIAQKMAEFLCTDEGKNEIRRARMESRCVNNPVRFYAYKAYRRNCIETAISKVVDHAELALCGAFKGMMDAYDCDVRGANRMCGRAVANIAIRDWNYRVEYVIRCMKSLIYTDD